MSEPRETVEADRPPVTVEEMAKRWRRVQPILSGEKDPVETELETAQSMLREAQKGSAEAQSQRDIAYRDAKNHQELAITWQAEARRFEQQRDAMEVQMAQAIVKAEQYREKGAAMQRQRDELRGEVKRLRKIVNGLLVIADIDTGSIVQGEGTLAGKFFYFRARYNEWAFHLGDTVDGVLMGKGRIYSRTGDACAETMTREQAEQIICRCADEYLAATTGEPASPTNKPGLPANEPGEG